ncbi:MAG: hypothetical protein [Podoviridae sp. ctrTa16]|nr:MAG: hypothetical protein [Podoviridae sp. ctrTa16]
MNTLIEKANSSAAQEMSRFYERLSECNDVKGLADRFGYLATRSVRIKHMGIEEAKEYIIKRKKRVIEKDIQADINLINEVLSAPDLVRCDISVEWKRNSTWGANPTAEADIRAADYYNSYSSGSIGGCGYDKLSTAVAKAVNQSPSVLKLLFTKVVENPGKSYEELFGYGVSGMFPKLSEGVGVSCYNGVFEKLGWIFETVASGKTYDCFKIWQMK